MRRQPLLYRSHCRGPRGAPPGRGVPLAGARALAGDLRRAGRGDLRGRRPLAWPAPDAQGGGRARGPGPRAGPRSGARAGARSGPRARAGPLRARPDAGRGARSHPSRTGDPRVHGRRPEQPGDRRTGVGEREHREDERQTGARQARGGPPHAGHPARQGAAAHPVVTRWSDIYGRQAKITLSGDAPTGPDQPVCRSLTPQET